MVTIRADEISKIIRERIEQYNTEVKIVNTGTVLQVGDGIARIYGLDEVFRNFNPIPFRSTRTERYQTGFPRPLGSTNPCASAVHMEPFPSSAFKVLI